MRSDAFMMKIGLFLFFILGTVSIWLSEATHSNGPKPTKLYNQKKQPNKFHNPNFVRDRFKYEIFKPELSPETFKFRDRPFHPAWQDYCDPYHCNDYHKLACGLNRQSMIFRWFQSTCHIILNNQCSSFRGHKKFDWIDQKYCYNYVLNLRSHCPTSCPDTVHPVCGISTVNGRAALFVNHCALEKKNCDPAAVVDEYEEVDVSICEAYLNRTLSYVQKDLV